MVGLFKIKMLFCVKITITNRICKSISYRWTICAYPDGGGCFWQAKKRPHFFSLILLRGIQTGRPLPPVLVLLWCMADAESD